MPAKKSKKAKKAKKPVEEEPPSNDAALEERVLKSVKSTAAMFISNLGIPQVCCVMRGDLFLTLTRSYFYAWS
jgi:hypothetical protein